MIHRTNTALIVAGSLCAVASNASADFVGQVILGPLNAGDSVFGSTLGDSDDNDGWDSGIHIFDIWDGGDDVYALNWVGGDINITLTSLDGSDNDLFLYTPDNLDSSSIYSIRGPDDSVQLLDAAPGIYYINVDSQFFSEGAYHLEVAPVPGPGALGLLGLAMLRGGRRRR